MASIRIVPWRTSKESDGLVPLYLVIRNKNQRATLALPVRLKEKDWNAERGEIRKSHPEHIRLNLRLAEVLQKARAALQDALFEDASISPHRIKSSLIAETNCNAGDFFDYYEAQLKAYRKRTQWSTGFTPIWWTLLKRPIFASEVNPRRGQLAQGGILDHATNFSRRSLGQNVH